MSAMRRLPLLLAFGLCLPQVGEEPSPPRTQLSARLKTASEKVRQAVLHTGPVQRHAVDAEVYIKAVQWALRFDQQLTPADLKLLNHCLLRAEERAAALFEDRAPWASRTGRLVRGFRSRIDDSVQPYGLLIPPSYTGSRPFRLDVVLHGSTRPVGMSEARFLQNFDEDAPPSTTIPSAEYIELHPLGRVENCYRWAGETDVFEAIEDVCSRYNIDRSRIVLRGMSMGASGTWHLGLKHPDRFAALGPYCGYVDTHRFSETPGMNFVKVGVLPSVQEDALHMLDSVDYAANAQMVPVAAAMGENDPFFQAHVLMAEAMQREGLTLLNLISPGTAHVQDPATWAEQMRRIARYLEEKDRTSTDKVRFVTWTLKYSRCRWISILELEQHYRRAEIEAVRTADRTVIFHKAQNIRRFALSTYPERVLIEGQTIPVVYPRYRSGGPVFSRYRGRWAHTGYASRTSLSGKRPGVQGPIDDAFTQRFLCVRGSGTPWNPAVHAWAEASLKRCQHEWAKYFRGELPVKNDTEVTEEDRRSCSLILFGDPGSNRLIPQALSSFDLRWTKSHVQMGQRRYSAQQHAPAAIGPSPWSPERYVVLNSGHTFREAELSRLNYLLFPRWGDWAVIKTGAEESVVDFGWCDEQWKIPAANPSQRRR
jgi:poly(3-hydroxybutyrate) depolymerase